MININELRIGNLVYNEYAKAYQIIDGYTFWHTMFPDDVMHLVELIGLQPIELSPLILEKCGFEGGYFTYDYGKLSIHLPSNSYKNGRTFFNSWCIIEESVKYLHQLQNLYYSLTNEELNIKL